MTIRTWLWVGSALSAVIFLPSAIMAFSALGVAVDTGSGTAGSIAFLFLLLPMFCLLAPYRAWRIHRRRPYDRNAAIMMVVPVIYAVFLVLFLL